MELPSYDDLPEIGGVRTSWGLWGEHDRLGCLNLLTPERALRGASVVRRGAVFPLDAALDALEPPLFDRGRLAHDVSAFPGGTAFDDHITFLNTQGSSQWDGLRHLRDADLGFYNGQPPEALGIEGWAQRGLVTRAVVVDVGRFLAGEGRALDLDRDASVEAGALRDALHAQGIEVERGDVLLVRTGWLDWYRSLGPEARVELSAERRFPGLASDVEVARTLWNLGVAAVAADNPGFEVMPPRGGHLHRELLPRLGMPIGELWDLGDLAADCAADGVHECLLTSAPLHLPGGVASPPNALAVK